MPFLELPAGRIQYHQHGETSRPALILLHNGFDSSRTWEACLPLLADRFHLTCYDRAGYGGSAPGPVPTGDIVADGAHELRLLMDALGIARALLVGHCLGAAIALYFASGFPHRSAGVVAEACGFFGDRDTVRKSRLIFQPWEDLAPETRDRLLSMHGPGRARAFWEASCA